MIMSHQQPRDARVADDNPRSLAPTEEQPAQSVASNGAVPQSETTVDRARSNATKPIASKAKRDAVPVDSGISPGTFVLTVFIITTFFLFFYIVLFLVVGHFKDADEEKLGFEPAMEFARILGPVVALLFGFWYAESSHSKGRPPHPQPVPKLGAYCLFAFLIAMHLVVILCIYLFIIAHEFDFGVQAQLQIHTQVRRVTAGLAILMTIANGPIFVVLGRAKQHGLKANN
jgi:hypothetical protein